MYLVLTLRDGQKADKCDGVPMRATDTIGHTPIRHIQWVVLVLTGGNGDCCLVTPQNRRAEGSPTKTGISTQSILQSISTS